MQKSDALLKYQQKSQEGGTFNITRYVYMSVSVAKCEYEWYSTYKHDRGSHAKAKLV